MTWCTAAELADLRLPRLPTTKRGIAKAARSQGWATAHDPATGPLARRRRGNGGGLEYHVSLLPSLAQAALAARSAKAEIAERSAGGGDSLDRESLWVTFDGLPDKSKAAAQTRLDMLDAVNRLAAGGVGKGAAVFQVGALFRTAERNIYRWFKMVAGLERGDWLPALAPRHGGGTEPVDLNPDAWAFLKGDYLRAERPSFEACWRRLEGAAAANGWGLPSVKTARRRIDAIMEPIKVLARYGPEALKGMYPAQERDRSHFHALEGVNADGHKFDVFVKWPGGEVTRPILIAFQDLYSGAILSWRLDRTENKEMVRLALGDLVEDHGIPEHCWLDNGRSFASKFLTGGMANRYRFKVRDEEPAGILTTLGVEVHWTHPYSGQSKPIERAFRDLCDNVAKHPALAGAWTGNSPVNKPENHGSRAVDFAAFETVVAEGIVEHNARSGRRTKTAQGRSFLETFEESYSSAPIRKATEGQRRLWLLAAEGVRVRKRDATILLMGNRYKAEALYAHMGQAVVARFDPQNLLDGLHVYESGGLYIGFAEAIDPTGFADTDKAREYARERRGWMKAHRAALDAERRLKPKDVARMMAKAAPAPAAADAKVIRPAFGRPVLATRPAPKAAPLTERQARALERVKATPAKPRSRKRGPGPTERFARAVEIERALDAKRPIDAEALRWIEGYRATSEYRSRKRMAEDFGLDAILRM